MRLACAFLTLLTTAFMAACGGGGASLPEPPACPIVAPLPAPATGQGGTQRYLQAVATGQTRVATPGRLFLDRWPTRKFSRTAEFREDLVRTSDDAVCFAQQLISIPPPSARFEEYDAALDGVLSQFIEDLAVGRQAARQRNVSKFRDWLKVIDELPGKLALVDATRPSARP